MKLAYTSTVHYLHWVLKIMAIGSFVFFLYTLYLIAIGAFTISNFDGALQLLAQIYTTKGYVPYKDFGVVYPPWHFMLVGHLFPFTSFFERNGIYATTYGLLAFTGYRILATHMVQKKDTYISAILFFFINSIILRAFGATNAFPILTFMVIATSSLAYIVTQKKQLLWMLFIFSALIVLMRWDWITVLVVSSVGSSVLLLMVNMWKRRIFEVWINRQLRMTGATVGGYVIGVVILFLYLNSLNVTQEAVDFFVTIPISIIGPYRKLPMPGFVSPLDGDSLLYVCIILLGVIGYEIYLLWQKKKSDIKRFELLYLSGNLLLFILPVLIYSLRRPSLSFFLPFFYILGIVWIIFHSYFKRSIWWWVLFLLTILPIPIRGWYLLDMKIYNPAPHAMEDEMRTKSQECINLAKGIKAKTIFIGRTSYEQFRVNNPSLYLQFLDLKPATKYISDEPGLQNSCHYGERIVNELRVAQKPLLVFLDPKDQEADSPAIQGMKSCDKIETFLEDEPYSEIGSCTSYNVEYMVRMYQ